MGWCWCWGRYLAAFGRLTRLLLVLGFFTLLAGGLALLAVAASLTGLALGAALTVGTGATSEEGSPTAIAASAVIGLPFLNPSGQVTGALSRQ